MRMRIKPLADGTTEVDIKLLDDGRACVHWLQECDGGPIFLQGHPKLREAMGRPPDGRYRIACNPAQNSITSQKRGNVRYICMTSGDPAAATCPKCLATPAAVAALAVASVDDKAAVLVAEAIRSL